MSVVEKTDLSTDFSRARLESLLKANHDGIFWRHDVDYSLECARHMAQLEHEYGVSSTYYLRTFEEDYKPGSAEFWETVLALHEYGHRVGMHVDLQVPKHYVISTLQIRKACIAQEQMLSQDSRWPKTPYVSLHRPPINALFRLIPGYCNAMEPVWSGRYVADSRGSFRYESPEHAIETKRSVQINLHPEWWFLPSADAQTLREREQDRVTA